MRLRTTLVLFAVAGALAAYILLVERRAATTGEALAMSRKLLPRFDRMTVPRIGLARAGVELTLGLAGDGRWRIHPGDLPADTAAVERLLAALETAEIHRSIEDPSGLAAGLETPAVSLAIGAERLRMGRRDPTGRGVYLSRNGDGSVLVVDSTLLEAADRPLDEMRDRRLFPVEAPSIRSAGWSAAAGSPPGSERRLTRRDRRWYAGRSRVRSDRVDEALRDLAGLRATTLGSPPVMGAPTRDGDVVLNILGTSPLAIRLWKQGCAVSTDMLGRRSGTGHDEWLCVPAADVDRIVRALEGAAAPDRRLLTVLPQDISAVSVTVGQERLELKRDGGVWKIVAPTVDYAADAGEVASWLTTLAAYRAGNDVESMGPANQETIRLVVDGGGSVESVAFDRTAGGNVTMTPEGEAPRSIDVEILPLLATEPLRFRSRIVLSFFRHDAKRLETETPLGGERAVKDPADIWRLDRPVAVNVDPDTLDGVLGAFSELTAQRFLPGAEPLAVERSLVVTVEAPGAAAITHRLQVERPRAGGCRAALAGETAGTFDLPPATCTSLRQPLALRRLVEVDDVKLLAVSFSRGGSVRGFEKRGPDWFGVDGAKASAVAVASLLAGLRNVRAAEVAGYGAPDARERWVEELTVRTEGTADQRVLLGKSVRGLRPARVAGRNVFYRVSDEAIRPLDALLGQPPTASRFPASGAEAGR